MIERTNSETTSPIHRHVSDISNNNHTIQDLWNEEEVLTIIHNMEMEHEQEQEEENKIYIIKIISIVCCIAWIVFLIFFV